MSRSIATTVNATTQLGVQYSVVRLYSWPELPEIQAELVPDVARVCALLAIRPTGATLIPRLLNIPRERVNHIIELLYLHGHLADGAPRTREEMEKASAALAEIANTNPQPLMELPDGFDAHETAQPARSLIGRLWGRLTGGRA
ncbi:hypothetical protein [Hydrogenophaga sp. 5NK40-0174]|uniref:hypothetical protein n=1 Tax=Hydrogenophaga sp. 5NK40-0174 TaxID=3127649 RepID=UPI003101F09C